MVKPDAVCHEVISPESSNPLSFVSCYKSCNIVLTEGAVVERLKSEYRVQLDPFVNHAGLIYNGPDTLATIYKEYIEIACRYHLPLMLMTPTRKVNAVSHALSPFHDRPLISDCCRYLKEIRSEYFGAATNIFVGGLLGCKGDAYQAEGSLDTVDAYNFHKPQVAAFREDRVDFLFAGIMPALGEALGMARAMAESDIPYIISFMIRKDGRLLDGTSIAEAIGTIDGLVDPQPLCYMSNCVHPVNLRLAMACQMNRCAPQLKRFSGIQANASPLSPEQLNNCGTLQQGNFDDLIDELHGLVKEHRFKIVGGCCGTNGEFMEKLAKRLSAIDQALGR